MGAQTPPLDEAVLIFPAAASRAKGKDVERINQFDLYTLGQTIKGIAPFEEDVPCGSVFSALMSARTAMKQLLDGKPTPLGVSRATAQQFYEQLDSIWETHFRTAGEDGKKSIRFPEDDTPPIPSWTWYWMRQSLERFETVFREDMREAAAYIVPKHGIYSTPALVDHADETFPSDVASFIPDKAKADFKAAGRCLAFNLLTASGYHVGRAVEGMLESYYQFFCQKGPEITLNGWAAYISELDKVLQTKAYPEDQLSEKTLKELDQMREDYRNPLAHPRVVLNESEARMVFSNGESLIIGMAGELKKAVKAKSSATGGASAAFAILNGGNG